MTLPRSYLKKPLWRLAPLVAVLLLLALEGLIANRFYRRVK